MEGCAIKAGTGRAGAPGCLPGLPCPSSTSWARLCSPGLTGENGSHINHQRQSREKAHFSLLAAGQLQTANEKQKLSLDKRFTGARVLAAPSSEHRATRSGAAAPPASRAPPRGPPRNTQVRQALVPHPVSEGERGGNFRI